MLLIITHAKYMNNILSIIKNIRKIKSI